MVVCNMDIPRPPAAPPMVGGMLPVKVEPESVRSRRSSRSRSHSGFRLVDNQQDETGSVYSVYKQKIDAMFESDSSCNTKNSVQARIEKMFTDVAKDSGVSLTEIGCHVFSVDYMGSVLLHEKVSSLTGLQKPLRELYFSHKRNSKQKKNLTGRLEISSVGLKVQYQGEKGDLEQLNSFPTIAVWSAVKFVLQHKTKTSYAFLPLITDPDNLDKQTLFRTLDNDDKKYVGSTSHSPLFAVVMRRIGGQKQLECHGFICQTSEDAIVIAATLYKSLMAHMKSKDKRPKTKNGISCMSITSSIPTDVIPVRPPRKKRSSTSSTTSDKDNIDVCDTQPLILSSSSKPPKKSTKNRRAPKAPDIKQNPDEIEILPYVESPSEQKSQRDCDTEVKTVNYTEKINTYMTAQQKQLTAEIKQIMSEGSNRGLKRAQSFRKSSDDLLSKGENSGDILTKVTIPRSGSFLNAGGLTRYKSKSTKTNGHAVGGSPLGFHELFNEFRLQEGLHSVDEILGVIIDPEGMSFNDLKPIYKEFLLKLAVTLTKDELYQRSKIIMRRQKKRSIRKGAKGNLRRRRSFSVHEKIKGLKHIFRKTLKMKIGMRLHKMQKENIGPTRLSTMEGRLPESSISTSSYDTRQFMPKQPLAGQVTKRHNYRRRSGPARERTSTSEESDFFSLNRGKGQVQFQGGGGSGPHNRNSSSGYVSCSECSYDSDTCTCVSADKCYCSLRYKNQKSVCRRKCQDKCYCSWKNRDTPSWCACDTDSCTDSNKCYCQKGDGGSVLEQLHQRGFIPSPASITSPQSHRKLCKNYSNTKSSRSLEYMHNPTEKYYEKMAKPKSGKRSNRTKVAEKLALDYELFTIARNRLQSAHDRAVLAKAMTSSQMSLCKHGSVKSTQSAARYSMGRVEDTRLRSASIAAGEPTEALSVKKSAEIAALFADIKLSQTTDITHLIPRNYDSRSKRSKPKQQQQQQLSRMDKAYNSNQLVNTGRLYVSKNKMYSAKNGLYTIQSQSDDSRRSSECDSGRRGDREYFNVNDVNVSSNIENSLGYLP